MGKKIFYYGAPVIGRFPSFLHVTQEDNDDICFAIGSDGKVQTIALDVMTFSLLIVASWFDVFEHTTGGATETHRQARAMPVQLTVVGAGFEFRYAHT